MGFINTRWAAKRNGFQIVILYPGVSTKHNKPLKENHKRVENLCIEKNTSIH